MSRFSKRSTRLALTTSLAREEGLRRGGRWGSAVRSDGFQLREVTNVATPYSRHETPIVNTIPGSVALAEVTLPGNQSFVAVSLYGAFDNGYSVRTVHKELSDLTPLLDSPLGKRVVVGGDLNCSTQVDPPHRARHRNLFERFASFGLINLLDLTSDGRARLENCWCDDELCRHVRHIGIETAPQPNPGRTTTSSPRARSPTAWSTAGWSMKESLIPGASAITAQSSRFSDWTMHHDRRHRRRALPIRRSGSSVEANALEGRQASQLRAPPAVSGRTQLSVPSPPSFVFVCAPPSSMSSSEPP
jgi:hypothetical protein